MLGIWRSHAEYQSSLINNLLPFYISNKSTVEYYSDALTKLYILDLDVLKLLIEPRFSTTGKPSNQQPEIFRSFVLMSELHYHSIPKWIGFLKANPILCYAIGISPNDVPGVGSHYDFIDRLWLENPEVLQNRQDSLHPFKSKPRKKLGKNQKQPPRHPGIIKKFADLALQGKSFENRPERLLQQIFANVAVEPSANAGLLGDTNKITVSGDGTCINTGGSPFGIKTCDCVSKGIYNCHCHRKFSDPDARHGWDSYHEVWYYGHCGYFLTVYNPELKKDLPIYLRLVQAQRYDGVTAIVALSEVRKLYPLFNFEKFLGDGAHDNNPTYDLLHAWNMKAIIPLNKKSTGNFKYEPPIKIDDNGFPICMCGIPMIYDYYDKIRHRIKWRCPYAKGTIQSCSCKEQCSPSTYGRTVYTKPEWDLRLFTSIPRGSKQWKDEMNKRTSSERVNKRILNDYNMEEAHARGKKRWSWWTMVHSTNILLDARIKVSKFNFVSVLDELISKTA